jgi:hypothetical protein
MFEIIPIALTGVNWPVYLATAQKVLGFSIAASFDKHGIKNDLTKFLVSLEELHTEEPVEPNVALSEAGSLLRHASASFMCLLPAETVNLFREEVDLAINSSQTHAGFRLCIITGTLLQWRDAVINCSVSRLTRDVRMLCNQFMAYFENAGLGAIWGKFNKTQMSDQTFRLMAR